MEYAVIDVETSGGKFNEESIIEIAVYRFNGEQITDTFISLINPEKKIDFFVQKLTGITQKMVKTAPKFYELAKRLLEITDNAVIVAHNVEFDYRVIKTEYLRLGFDFQRDTLDTLSLSKTLLPNLPSYSLGKLCDSLGIPLCNRHRAFGDARATVNLLQLLLAKDSKKKIIQSYIRQPIYISLNNKIIRLLEDLPLLTGVFYLHNGKGTIIYIDKAESISNSIQQILTGKNFTYLQKQTENISFELTGNEIIAEIKSKNEIKINNPKYIPERKMLSQYGIIKSGGGNQMQLSVAEITKGNKKDTILSFSSLKKAQDFFTNLMTRIENKEIYIKEFLSDIYLKKGRTLLIDEGRKIGESSFLYLDRGVLKGYGFYTLHSQIKDIDRINKIMVPVTGSVDVYLEIRKKIMSDKFKKILFI